MKIDPSDKLHHSISSPSVKHADAAKGPAFKDVLQKTVNSRSTEQITRPPSIKPVMHPVISEPNAELFKSTERSLNTLERYQKLLADPKADLRSIDPTIQQMKKESEALSSLINEETSNSPIKQIAEETLLTLSKEIARYDGGAYVN